MLHHTTKVDIWWVWLQRNMPPIKVFPATKIAEYGRVASSGLCAIVINQVIIIL